MITYKITSTGKVVDLFEHHHFPTLFRNQEVQNVAWNLFREVWWM